MTKLLLMAIAGCVCLNAGQIVYTDFGAGSTYNTTTGKGVSGAFPSIAEGFTPTANGLLSEVDLALAYFNPSPPLYNLTIALETNSSGIPSGTILDSWSFSDTTVTSTAAIYSFLSTATPALSTASEYWVVITANASDPNGYVWLENTQGVTGEDYNGGSGWQIGTPASSYPSLAFDVQIASASSSVPEPGYAGVTGLAILLAFGVSKRNPRK